MRSLLSQRLQWRLAQASDRRRLARLHVLHAGLDIHPHASSNLASSRFDLWPGARLKIGAGVATERRHEGITFHVGEGASLEVGEGTWLRSDLTPVRLFVFPGAHLEIGPDSFLNGCHLSAKESVVLGRKAWVGPGSRVFDSDQHALDADRPERTAPVRIGDFAWVASDVTVLRGVEIGAHSVIGARAVVTRSIAPHKLAVGIPAVEAGDVGDRSQVPI